MRIMAIPLIDTLFDLLSAASGALVGAVVTGFFNRGRRQQLANQVVLGRQALEKMKLENDRLLEMVREKENMIQSKENMILEMQMQILSRSKTAKPARKTKKTGK